MTVNKSKALLMVVAFFGAGAGILYAPNYIAPLLGFGHEGVEKAAVTTTRTLPLKKDELKGTLFGVTAKSVSEVKETSLHLVLKGTAPASKPSDSFAVVLVGGKEEKLVSVGDDIERGVSLYKVDPNFILINRNGAVEKLSYPANPDHSSSAKGAYFASSDTSSAVGNSALNSSGNSQNILRNGSLVQQRQNVIHRSTNTFQTFVENQVIGHYQSEYKKDPKGTLASIGVKQSASGYQVGDGSPLLNFGLQVGDVVMSVNGLQASQIIGNPNAIAQIRAAGVANMQVQRGGSVIQISRTF